MTCLNLFAYIFVYIKLENKFPKMNNLALMISSYVVVIHDRKSTRLNSSHSQISYAVFCLKKKKQNSPYTPPLYINTTACASDLIHHRSLTSSISVLLVSAPAWTSPTAEAVCDLCDTHVYS